jgi:signal transduction histidine kinase
VLHENTLKVLETQELILDRAIALVADPKADGRLDDALRELERGRGQIASIWVLDQNGEVIAGSTPLFERLNARDRDYFQAQRNGATGTYVGKAFTGRATEVPSFGFSRRLPSADGAFRGIVNVSVSSGYFSDFFHRSAPGIDRVAALIRADGEILARDPPLPDRHRVPADDPFMQAAAHADSGLLWRTGAVDGVERLFGYRRVAGYPLIVTVAVPRSAILRPWARGLMRDAAVAGFVVVAMSGLTIFALRQTRREESALVRLVAESREREQIEAQLQRSQKLEALGQLTGNVAHDFGNLLTPILGNLQVLQEQIDHTRLQSRVRGALAAAERGEKLVHSLLAFARQEPLAFAAIDINALIDDMQDLLRHSLPSTIRLTLALASETWPVHADASRLEMALLNLAVNARDAMPEGGYVTIATANAVLHGDPDGLAGDYVATAVSDTGTGMTPETLARAFEPFFTTKPAGKGTGLGLASLYGFVKQCGGGTRITSAPGEGTTVTLYLPRARAADARTGA